jgi:hypothetical protein
MSFYVTLHNLITADLCGSNCISVRGLLEIAYFMIASYRKVTFGILFKEHMMCVNTITLYLRTRHLHLA